MIKKLKYYFRSTYRRQIIDSLLKKYAFNYLGVVLDIGGRSRGIFQKPKQNVTKWIFADIEEKHNPDILLDVADMNAIETGSIDIVNAIELFEYVEKINEGISECYRVLKPDGKLILSVPFLYPIHADPYDFQRWTLTKWIKTLKENGFIVEIVEINGQFFTVKNEMYKALILSLPVIVRHIAYLLFPVFDIINLLDNTKRVKNHKKLGNFHGGYYNCKKINNGRNSFQ